MPRKSKCAEDELCSPEDVTYSAFKKRVLACGNYWGESELVKCGAIVMAMSLGVSLRGSLDIIGEVDTDRWNKILGKYLIDNGVALNNPEDAEEFMKRYSTSLLVVVQRTAAISRNDSALLKFLGGCVLNQSDNLNGSEFAGYSIAEGFIMGEDYNPKDPSLSSL